MIDQEEPVTKWKVDGQSGIPRRVECDLERNLDSELCRIFDNTHFSDEDEAWDKGEGEMTAGIRLAASVLRRVECDLEKAKSDATVAVLQMDAFMAARSRRFGSER